MVTVQFLVQLHGIAIISPIHDSRVFEAHVTLSDLSPNNSSSINDHWSSSHVYLQPLHVHLCVVQCCQTFEWLNKHHFNLS